MGILDGIFGQQSGLLGELPPWMQLKTGNSTVIPDWLTQLVANPPQQVAPAQPQQAPGMTAMAQAPMPQQPQMEPRKSIFDAPDTYPGAGPIDRPNFGSPLGAPQMPQAQPQQAPGMNAMAQAPQSQPQGGGSNPMRGVLGFLGDTLMHGPIGAIGHAYNANKQQATYDRLISAGVDPKQAWFIMNAPQQGQLSGIIGKEHNGIVINGRLVDPRTGKMIADYSDTKAPETKEFETTGGGKAAVQWNNQTKRWEPIPGLDAAGGPGKPPAGYRWKDEKDPSKGLDPIANGPATHIPAETAGRVAMMETAQKELPKAKEILLKNRGDLGQYPLESAQYTTGIGDVGRAARAVRIGIEATLRAMTGAAAPETEVKRYEDMFLPKPTDNVATATQKLRLLDDFMTSARTSVTQGRVPSSQAPQSSLAPSDTKPPDPLGIR